MFLRANTIFIWIDHDSLFSSLPPNPAVTATDAFISSIDTSLSLSSIHYRCRLVTIVAISKFSNCTSLVNHFHPIHLTPVGLQLRVSCFDVNFPPGNHTDEPIPVTFKFNRLTFHAFATLAHPILNPSDKPMEYVIRALLG